MIVRRGAGLGALLLAVASGTGGCGQVIHPAAVQPGFTFDALVGAARVRHEPMPSDGDRTLNQYLDPPGPFDPYSSWRSAVQIGAGYGWRFSQHLGLQTQLTIGTQAPPVLDTYGQLMGWPVDAGVGALLSFGFLGAYGMVGKGLALSSRTELRFDAGARTLFIADGADRGWGTMALLSLRHGPLTVGVWSDNTFFDSASYDDYCDEICEPRNFARWRAAGGLYLRLAARLIAR